MKIKNHIIFFLTVVLFSCSSEDNTPSSWAGLLTQAWKVDRLELIGSNKTGVMYQKEGFPYPIPVIDYGKYKWEFKKGGTFTFIPDFNGTWSLKNQTLNLKIDNGKIYNYSIQQLDETHLKMTRIVPASTLDKNTISNYKLLFDVDISNGFTESWQLYL
ncbi:lipocalin-like domain-containing protein [Spirosoma litoris]